MEVAVVGLGLIGGSIAKAVKAYTEHTVRGMDASEAVVEQALLEGAMDAELCREDYERADLILVAIYPQAAVKFLKEHASLFKPGSIVVDLCGVKRYVCDQVQPLFENTLVTYIGGHPMAGLEVSGYVCSKADLFQGASMIFTPHPDTPLDRFQAARDFFLSIGFGSITVTTPDHHDEVIAYTSQLAHVVSNAYIHSPAAEQNRGFSAGSYKDLTRVAKMNAEMWTELFLCNKEFLGLELDRIIDVLGKMRDHIRDGQEDELRELLARGSQRKQTYG